MKKLSIISLMCVTMLSSGCTSFKAHMVAAAEDKRVAENTRRSAYNFRSQQERQYIAREGCRNHLQAAINKPRSGWEPRVNGFSTTKEIVTSISSSLEESERLNKSSSTYEICMSRATEYQPDLPYIEYTAPK